MNLLCPWESAKYLIFSSNVPSLLFYSHFPAIMVALLFGILVFRKGGKSKIRIVLLLVSIFFSLWSIFDLIIWASNRPEIVLFFWSMQILFEPLVYFICLYMVYLFIKDKDVPFGWQLLGIILYLPIIIFLSTKYNLIGVTQNDCNAIEGFLAQYFTYIIEFIVILSILIISILEIRKISDFIKKREIKWFCCGVVFFLLAFSWGNIIGSFSDNWVLAQAGLIGMPIFSGFLAYLIVRYKLFNIKLIATQALVWILVILIGAQFFFIKVSVNFILTAVTFLGVIIFGNSLIKSVKKEIEQREQLEVLLRQRESLTHLVTHKVKGAFTRSKYIFAEILAGDYGAISPELKKLAEVGLESDIQGINTVDLVLNAANLQKGTVKYNLQPIDFKLIVEKNIDEMKGLAEEKGLKFETEIKEGSYGVLGDSFWLEEVVHNLIDNSIKYTKTGNIKVGLENKDKKVLFFVKDTGVGITEEDKKNLFTEGGRGKNSVLVNVDSTGYGLYTVKLVVDAHGGRIWVESKGQDMGTEFFVELEAAKIA